ncbi:MAG TPA: glutathione S-transferase family protein [Methylomirabilota bacterium]|nr:glutathione S-transferase family protein [Methylomirabilota bacterium]
MTERKPDITLYDFELSASCYKIRLLLALLKIDYKRVPINFFPAFEHRKPAFLKINPLGQLPALTDGEVVLRDAQAILAYLAKAYDKSGRWLPEDPVVFGQVMMWLFFAASELSPATLARLNALLDFPADGPAATQAARKAFRIVDDHMTHREFAGGSWVVGDHATLADLVLFPSIALSRDFGVEHDQFPALRRWIRRLRGLDSFIVMPGIPEIY